MCGRHAKERLARRGRRVAAALAAGLLALATGGCRADVEVGVAAGRDGTGTVSVTVVLDEAARDAVGDLGAELRAADLERAGWRVAERAPGRVRLERPFATTAGADAALAQITGGDGGVRLALDQDRSFARVVTRLSGAVDLARGLDPLGDEGLAAAAGTRTGLDALDQQAVSKAVRLTVRADLPGGGGSAGPVAVGDRADVDIEAGATNVVGLAAAAGALAAAVAAAAVALRGPRVRSAVAPRP